MIQILAHATQLRCSGEKTSCDRCLAKKVRCEYPEPTQRKGPKRSRPSQANLQSKPNQIDTSLSDAPERPVAIGSTFRGPDQNPAIETAPKYATISWATVTSSPSINSAMLLQDASITDAQMAEARDQFNEGFGVDRVEGFLTSGLDDSLNPEVLHTTSSTGGGNGLFAGSNPLSIISTSPAISEGLKEGVHLGNLHFHRPDSLVSDVSYKVNNPSWFLGSDTGSSRSSGPSTISSGQWGDSHSRRPRPPTRLSAPSSFSTPRSILTPTGSSRVPIMSNTMLRHSDPQRMFPPIANQPCQCLTSVSCLLETLSVEVEKFGPRTIGRLVNIMKRVLIQCDTLLDCETCTNLSNYMMLLIILCQKIACSFDEVLAILTEQYKRLHERDSLSEDGTDASQEGDQEPQEHRIIIQDYDLDVEEEPCLYGALTLIQVKKLRALLDRIRGMSRTSHIIIIDRTEEQVKNQLRAYDKNKDSDV